MNRDTEILERLHNIERILDVNTAHLAEHIRRTEMLESKMEVVDNHVKMVNGVIRFLTGIGAVLALAKLLHL